MTLTVEDGTGLSNADALISLADVDAYHAAQGNSSWTGDTDDKETAIRRASAHLSTAISWQGLRREGRDQALAWPRTGVVDEEGYSVPYTSIPTEIEKACAEVALRELIEPGSMSPDFTPAERVKSEGLGPMAVEYDVSRSDPEAYRPVLLIVRDIAGALMANSGSNRLSGERTRA